MGRWTDATLGETIGPVPFTLSPDFHHRFVDSTRNALPAHATLVDPTIAGNLSIYLLGSRYPGPIIHSHQTVRAHATVPVGSNVDGVATISLKQMRRDKAYVAVDCEFTRDGELVWTTNMTCVWPEVHLRGEV